MPSIGIARFRKMLERLLEKSRENGVQWGYDLTEKCYCIGFEDDAEISVYRHKPRNEPAIAGALLRIQEQLVITLEAEEPEDDWQLLNALYESATSIADSDSTEIEAIERQLASCELLGFAEAEAAQRSSRVGRHTRRRAIDTSLNGTSLDDLMADDSPLHGDSRG